MIKVLYIQPGQGLGGSHISLLQMLKCAPSSQESYLALSSPPQEKYEKLVKPYVSGIFYLELPTWQKFTRKTIFEKVKAPLSHTRRLLRLFSAARVLKQIMIKEGINLVHTNNSICAAGALAARNVSIPHVWHIRESFGSDRHYRPILGDRLTFWLMRKWSEAIICNSRYTAEPFHKKNIPHIIIQNGIDLDLFTRQEVDGKTLKSKLGIGKNDLVVGMVGNLTTELKKHDEFLDVAALIKTEIPGIKFVVFGGSNDLDQTAYTRKLASKSKTLRIADQVIWADFIDDSGAIMTCLDVLIHPALTEGSGRVIMEAMAAGKPVVTMRSGGVQELIQDGKTGYLVEPGVLHQIAIKVINLLKNEGLRKAIGERGQNYARVNFSNQASMLKITDVYKSLT